MENPFEMELLYITNNPDEAKVADSAGVDRIFVDTEVLGKAERQKGLNTYLGNHVLEDVKTIKKAVKNAKVMVRINPLNPNTAYEVEKSIEYSADMIMLPMFTHRDEVEEVSAFINGRTQLVALVETAEALVRLDDIMCVSGLSEVHIGLNDLTICLKLDFLFEPLAYGIIDFAAEKLNKQKMKWGFGGIARVGCGIIPCEMILVEHRRIGSERVILSSAFRPQKDEVNFSLLEEVKRIRERIVKIENMSEECLEKNRVDISQRIKEVASRTRRGM